MFKNAFSKRSSLTANKTGDLCSKRANISAKTWMFLYERYLNETTNVLTLSFHWYCVLSLLFPYIITCSLASTFLHCRTDTKIILGTFLLFLCRGRLVSHIAMLPSDRTSAHICLSRRHGTIVPYSYNNLLIGFYYEVFLSC